MVNGFYFLPGPLLPGSVLDFALRIECEKSFWAAKNGESMKIFLTDSNLLVYNLGNNQQLQSLPF